MRGVVTGGSGFIGFNLLQALADAHRFDHLISLDRVPPPAQIRGCQHVQVDLRDHAGVQPHLQGADVVFHLAAAANVDAQASTLRVIEDNVAATGVLLEGARQASVSRFVFASTVWVYMGVEQPWLTEHTPLLPPVSLNLYAATKISSELLCRAYHQQLGLPCTILRFETPYGPHMRADLVVSRFLQQALRDESITIAGDGRQTRNFIYVRDLIDGVIAAGFAPIASGKTYNLPGPEPVSIRELADVIREATRSPSPITFVDGRLHDSRGPQLSRALAESDLGWTPKVRIRDGIHYLLAWLLEESAHDAAGLQSIAAKEGYTWRTKALALKSSQNSIATP